MSEEQINATEEVVEPQDVETDSSSEALEETPSQQVEQEEIKEVPFHEHPRWQEIQKERQELKEQNQQLMQMLQSQATQKTPITQEQRDELEDKLSALDPAAREWMRDLYKDMSKITQRELQKAGKQFTEVINKQSQVIAELQEKEFRREHKDIAPNSIEERDIAELIKLGVPPTKAAWAIMGPKRAKEAETKGQVKKTQTTKMKQQANMEVPNVAVNAPIDENISFREALEREAAKSGVF